MTARRGSLHILASRAAIASTRVGTSAVGMSWPQPGMIFSVAPSSARCPLFHRHERIVLAMQHEGRRADRLRHIDRSARQDREHLLADADRIVRADERAFDPGAGPGSGVATGTVDDAIDVPNWIDASRSLPAAASPSA